MYTQEQLNQWLLEEQDQLSKLGIPVSKEICPDIAFSKATSWYGKCQQNRSKQAQPYKFRISISLYHLKSSERAIRNTLIHELLHTCPGCFNHGAKWKKYAQVVQRELGYDIVRCGGDKDKESPLAQARQERLSRYKTQYVLTCTKCGAEFVRVRKSNLVLHPENYRCRCGGVIERKK